jgi:hypothetical protein
MPQHASLLAEVATKHKAAGPPTNMSYRSASFIPMIVSNCALPLVIPSGKQVVFTKWTRNLEREPVSIRSRWSLNIVKNFTIFPVSQTGDASNPTRATRVI